MGCQNICQKDNDDKNYIIAADIGGKEQTRKNPVGVSRNAFKNKQLNLKSFNDTIKTSMNIHETIIEKDMLRFTIKASNIHKMIPVWVEKNNLISFSVAGLWTFEESEKMYNSIGCTDFEDRPCGMPFGCLAAYVLNGPYFVVYDGLTIENIQEGPLFMFQNNGLYSVTPKGSLEVEIRGIKPLSIYEIEAKMGWDLCYLDTSISEMKEDEVNLLIFVNKVRTNPKLFADQYLKTLGNTEAEVELYNLLITMDPIPRLETTSELYKISSNHAKDLGLNKLAGHESSNGMNMEQRLMANGINTKIFAENCIFGYNDPIEIILKLLIDEDNENRNQRKILLNKDFNKVGISIEHHSGEYCWSCIQDFILDQE